MAPTEILARQHADTLAPYCEQLGLRIALLTGRDKGKARAALLERLAGGEVDILVGTHALFQEDVVFHDLALAVINEQHRFGVSQSLGLAAKGQRDKGDRKSVVQGKRVSVSVDIGGRRIIHKKKT